MFAKKDKDLEEALLKELARIKSEIQIIQIWIDDSRTNRIARICYRKTKEKIIELIEAHKSLFQSLKRLEGWA